MVNNLRKESIFKPRAWFLPINPYASELHGDFSYFQRYSCMSRLWMTFPNVGLKLIPLRKDWGVRNTLGLVGIIQAEQIPPKEKTERWHSKKARTGRWVTAHVSDSDTATEWTGQGDTALFRSWFHRECTHCLLQVNPNFIRFPFYLVRNK